MYKREQKGRIAMGEGRKGGGGKVEEGGVIRDERWKKWRGGVITQERRVGVFGGLNTI